MHTHPLTVSLRRFAHDHDDIPAFHAAYLLIALICAALLNLGAFALLVAAHMTLDVVKYRERHGRDWKGTWDGVLHESLIDITVLLVGIVFSVYLHRTIGIASLSGLIRADIAMVRSVGLLIPKLFILHDVLKVVAHLQQYMENVHPRHLRGWSGVDHLCMYFSAAAVLLLMFAAPLMGVDWTVVEAALLEELVPWKL